MKSKRAKYSNVSTRTAHETGYSYQQFRRFYKRVTGLSLPRNAQLWDVMRTVIGEYYADRSVLTRDIGCLADVVGQTKQMRQIVDGVQKPQREVIDALLDVTTADRWGEVLDGVVDTLVGVLGQSNLSDVAKQLAYVRVLQKNFKAL